MFSHLQIYDPRERWLVGSADALLGAAAAAWRAATAARPTPDAPSRILLLRLERVGDLLMTLDAIAAVRRLAPRAHVRLVVGSWNEALAGLIPDVDRVETLDAGWLAREREGDGPSSLAARARAWRAEGFDLAINFEGDLRSNALAAVSGATRRVGFGMGGGGALLTDVVAHDPHAHTAANTLRLVERAFGTSGLADASPEERASLRPRLVIPDDARHVARALLDSQSRTGASPAGPYVGVHAGGGRQVKQWHAARFAAVADTLARRFGATIVLTGSDEDRPAVDAVRAAVDETTPVIDLVDRMDVVALAAVLARLSVFVTGDTGPMHLAAEIGTPIVAMFGPSDPARYGPLSANASVTRVQLPCSPCNRIRRPPARCVGHVPQCLELVDVAEVTEAAVRVMLMRQGREPGDPPDVADT